MTITEFAILPFKLPPNLSDPTLQSLFQKLSAWQSECSGFPLLFFTNPNDPLQIHLITGWTSVAAHEVWVRGERNQELLRVFAPYVEIQRVRMVHLGVDFEAIPKYARWMVVERHGDERRAEASTSCEWAAGSDQSRWSLIGRDLALDGGDVYRFVGVAGGGEVEEVSGGLAPIERWVLKRVEL